MSRESGRIPGYLVRIDDSVSDMTGQAVDILFLVGHIRVLRQLTQAVTRYSDSGVRPRGLRFRIATCRRTYGRTDVRTAVASLTTPLDSRVSSAGGRTADVFGQ